MICDRCGKVLSLNEEIIALNKGHIIWQGNETFACTSCFEEIRNENIRSHYLKLTKEVFK